MSKRILSTILTLALLVGLISAVGVTAVADDGEQITLNMTVRDFRQDGVLFGGITGNGREGLVLDTLGTDKKPVYNLELWQSVYNQRISNEMLDAQFNDVPGVNMRAEKTILLELADGVWSYYAPEFFPIDGELFGDRVNNHNDYFAMEIHDRIKYTTGAYFSGFLANITFCVDFAQWRLSGHTVNGTSRRSISINRDTKSLNILFHKDGTCNSVCSSLPSTAWLATAGWGAEGTK